MRQADLLPLILKFTKNYTLNHSYADQVLRRAALYCSHTRHFAHKENFWPGYTVLFREPKASRSRVNEAVARARNCMQSAAERMSSNANEKRRGSEGGRQSLY